MAVDLWLTFVAASTALLLIPGPTVLLVLAYSLTNGRQVAVASATGVALGDLIAISASLAGLGALLHASATLFTILKWTGAIYLVWMGSRLLFSAPSGHLKLPGTSKDITGREVFYNATIVTALNPKSIAFFVAFVPQFLTPTSPLSPQFAILIATFVTLATLNALAYALLADRLRLRIGRPSTITWLTRSGGLALIGMGIMTATLRRAT